MGQQLKVGDEVCHIKYYRNQAKGFKFRKVERITKTLAILNDGTKLVNDSFFDFSKEVAWRGYGSGEEWHIVTENIKSDYAAELERSKIESWFSSKEFTNEEKKIIWTKFNELNIL